MTREASQPANVARARSARYIVTVPAIGWRENPDGSLICPHRDLSVCRECSAVYADVIVDVYGRWFYDPTGEIREALSDDEITREGRALAQGGLL